MDMGFLQPILDKVPFLPYILMGLGSLLVVAQCVVVLTPSKADDAAWDKIESMPIIGSIISWLESFAIIKKK